MRSLPLILLTFPLLAVGCGPTSCGLVNPNPAMTNPSPGKTTAEKERPM